MNIYNIKDNIIQIFDKNPVKYIKINIHMIKVYYKQPILDIIEGISGGKPTTFGLVRDRKPDSNWGELRRVNMDPRTNIIDIVELTSELKIVLLEDLAYAYGHNTKLFREKLIEFNLI